jgi:hypothetical protein
MVILTQHHDLTRLRLVCINLTPDYLFHFGVMNMWKILLVLHCYLVFSTSGHALLSCPTPRSQDSGLKTGPCGGVGSILGGAQTTLQPGPQTIHFIETIFHPGSPFRISLSVPNSDNFEECILLNHIPHNDAGSSGQEYSVTVNIPNFNCTFCSIQLLQVMTNAIPANSSCTYNPMDTTNFVGGQCGANYHSCANVMINGTGQFNNSQCSEPSGWNFSGGYVYSQETGAWGQDFFLNDTRAPDVVKTASENASSICSPSRILITPSNTESPTASPTLSQTQDSNPADGSSIPVFVGVVGGILALAVVYFFGYTYRKVKEEKEGFEFTEMVDQK